MLEQDITEKRKDRHKITLEDFTPPEIVSLLCNINYMENIDKMYDELVKLSDNNTFDLNNINLLESSLVVVDRNAHQIISINKTVPLEMFKIIKQYGYTVSENKWNDKSFKQYYIIKNYNYQIV